MSDKIKLVLAFVAGALIVVFVPAIGDTVKKVI